MVHNETSLNVADNSGARVVKIFRLYGGSNRKFSSVGDIVLCSVKESISSGKVKKGDVVRAIIVRTKKSIKRYDGSRISFDDNACVLINNDGTPIGTRIFGPIAREVRDKGENFVKIASLAEEVL